MPEKACMKHPQQSLADFDRGICSYCTEADNLQRRRYAEAAMNEIMRQCWQSCIDMNHPFDTEATAWVAASAFNVADAMMSEQKKREA